MHHAPCDLHPVPCEMPPVICALEHVFWHLHRALCVLHPAEWEVPEGEWDLHHVACATSSGSRTMRAASCDLRLASRLTHPGQRPTTRKLLCLRVTIIA